MQIIYISGGGVMLLLPFPIECGLLTYRTHYAARDRGYYDFAALFILMAFLQLSRIKSFEQTKQLNPGEWGKMIGFDRIPEVNERMIEMLEGEIIPRLLALHPVKEQQALMEENPDHPVFTLLFDREGYSP